MSKENKSKKKDDSSSSDKEDKDEIKFEKKVSYKDWIRDSDKAADHTAFQPQLAKNTAEQPTNKIGSAWNTAGTWEEKKLNKTQIEDYFNKKIKETPFVYKDTFKMSKFSDFSGDVNNFFNFRLILYFQEEK
ncbi:MAG: hypothetical protein MJ252_18045 [archaeon]|nr:hypothetical protein [archaeon]